MTIDGIRPTAPPPPAASAGDRPVPVRTSAPPTAPPVTAVPTRAVQPVHPGSEADRPRLDLARMLQEAAELRHAGREVRVRLERDDAAEHVVVRVEDRSSGEVVAQYPPDELLRFYAAVRAERRGGGGLVDLAT